MQQINECFCDYNKNLLNQDFLNTNTAIIWDKSPVINTIDLDYTTDDTFVESSLLISSNGGTEGDYLDFNASELTDYSFTSTKTGKYIFSFKTFYEKFSFDTSLNCEMKLYSDLGGLIKTFSFTLGHPGGTVPNTFQYNKWLTFFEEVELIGGREHNFSFKFTIDNYYVPLLMRANFDGFKLEYIENRNQDVPSYYTKPQI